MFPTAAVSQLSTLSGAVEREARAKPVEGAARAAPEDFFRSVVMLFTTNRSRLETSGVAVETRSSA